MEYLTAIENKIVRNSADMVATLNMWRFKEERIVFTNGCFDVVHRGHVEYLAKSAELGTKLIIGLNTDASVRRLKGENRPINEEYARALLLASFVFVNKVILFDEDTPLELIRVVQPDVLVKGSDYKPENIVGYDVVKAKGGEIATIDFVPGFSTTSILQKV